MRIISQNRCVDVPYKKAVVYIYPDQDNLPAVWTTLGGPEDEDFLLGSYDSENRCIEILQEIRECPSFSYMMPKK